MFAAEAVTPHRTASATVERASMTCAPCSATATFAAVRALQEGPLRFAIRSAVQ